MRQGMPQRAVATDAPRMREGATLHAMQPFGFLRRLLGNKSERPAVMQIFTPEAAAERGPATRVVLAGVSLLGLAGAATIALGSLLGLLAAVGFIYFLLTQVLGVKLDVDPRAFVERAQAYANGAGRN
jgi:hypothetical protein